MPDGQLSSVLVVEDEAELLRRYCEAVGREVDLHRVGAVTDLAHARALAEAMAPLLGRPVIVENRPGAAGSLVGECRSWRQVWLAVVGWSFTLFNSVRVLAYLPTIFAIHTSGDATQHSLWTWGTWLGANLSMACWLYENNGQRVNRAVAVNLGNALMCGATLLIILWHRV